MGMLWVSYGEHPTLAHKWQLFTFFMDTKGVVFLSEVGDDDGKEGDTHLRRSRVPTKDLNAQFEAEIVDRQIQRNNEDIAA